MSDKKVVKSFLWGALTGAVTGAVTALLLAPKSGRELRSDISDTAQRGFEKTAEISRQAGKSVQTLAKRTTSFAADAKQAARRAATEFRSRKNNDVSRENEVAATEEKYIDDNSASL